MGILGSQVKNGANGGGENVGESGTATKLANARTIAISGAVTGTPTEFDGSKNIVIPITALNVSNASTGTLSVERGGTGTNSLANITAGKATKLASSVTINGTSFDGSSNITTTNWGTARNINISDSDGSNASATVSVNGSAAATLKLPSTIKASINGNSATATKLQNARTIALSGGCYRNSYFF